MPRRPAGYSTWSATTSSASSAESSQARRLATRVLALCRSAGVNVHVARFLDPHLFLADFAADVFGLPHLALADRDFLLDDRRLLDAHLLLAHRDADLLT